MWRWTSEIKSSDTFAENWKKLAEFLLKRLSGAACDRIINTFLNHNSRKLTSSHSRPRIIILIHQGTQRVLYPALLPLSEACQCKSSSFPPSHLTWCLLLSFLPFLPAPHPWPQNCDSGVISSVPELGLFFLLFVSLCCFCFGSASSVLVFATCFVYLYELLFVCSWLISGEFLVCLLFCFMFLCTCKHT
jgi:hypothetical protein